MNLQECGIKHFVYSSLPSVDKLSQGRFKNVVHFESKARIEEYAKEQLENATILIPGELPSLSQSWSHLSLSLSTSGAFLSNLANPMWATVKGKISCRILEVRQNS